MPENPPRNSEAIYRTLKEEMLNLVLKPGQRLSENELCERFSVSRCTPLMMERVQYHIRKQTVLLKGDFQAGDFYAMDSQMHAIWFHTMGKGHLWQIIQRSEINYTRFRMLDIVVMKNFKEIVSEHQQMFEIIRQKARENVEPLMRKHLLGGIERLGDRIETELKDYFIPYEKG